MKGDTTICLYVPERSTTMNSKKLLVSSLLTLLLVPIASPTVQTIKASTEVATEITAPVKESDYTYLKEQRSIWTKIAKAALRKAIQSRGAIVNAVRASAGNTVAKQVDKYYGAIVNALKPLLKWSEVPADAVKDAVYRELVKNGVSASQASKIAFHVKEALSWFI